MKRQSTICLSKTCIFHLKIVSYVWLQRLSETSSALLGRTLAIEFRKQSHVQQRGPFSPIIRLWSIPDCLKHQFPQGKKKVFLLFNIWILQMIELPYMLLCHQINCRMMARNMYEWWYFIQSCYMLWKGTLTDGKGAWQHVESIWHTGLCS